MPVKKIHPDTPVMLTPMFGLPLSVANTQITTLDRIASIMGSILSTSGLLSEEDQDECRTLITTTIAHRDTLVKCLDEIDCHDPSMLLVAIDEARITLDDNPSPMTERDEMALLFNQDNRMRHALEALEMFRDSALVHPDFITWQIGLRRFLTRQIKAAAVFL